MHRFRLLLLCYLGIKHSPFLFLLSFCHSLEEIQKNLELLRLSEQDSKFVQEQDKVWDSFDLVETYQEETQKCLVKSKGALDAVGVVALYE